MSQIAKTHFDLDALVRELRAAALDPDPVSEVKRIMDMAFAEATEVTRHIPNFNEDDVILYEDDDVSIWHCRFQPGKAVPPHDHRMSAIIGVYVGIERNIFYKSAKTPVIEQSSAADMGPGGVLSFGPSAIHSVECISDQPSCGIHVYLGPLSKIERNLYDLETGERLLFTDEAYDRLKGSDR